MKKLLAIPNDPTSAYFRSSKEDFLGEFNPQYNGDRKFNEVKFLNWRDEKDVIFNGVHSKSILEDKTDAKILYQKLTNFEIPFDSLESSFKKIFFSESENIKNFMNSYDPDLIRAFNTNFAVELGILARKYSNAPLIASGHDPTRLNHSIEELDAMVCESYELRGLCLEKFNLEKNRLHVIHNGIDLDFFYPRSKSEIKKTIPPEFLDAPYKIFSSSRLVRGKNIETLLQALALVKDDLPGLIHLHVGSEDSQIKKTKEIKKIKKKFRPKKYFLFFRP